MKKRLLFPVLCVLLTVVNATIAIGQNIETNLIVSSSEFFNSGDFINITKYENPKEISIKVNDGTLNLNLQIGGTVNSGTLIFEIYNPDGKKQDGLILMNSNDGVFHFTEDMPKKDYKALNKHSSVEQGYQIKSSGKAIKGHMVREFSNPLPGKWTIKVISKEVDGKYKVRCIFSMK